MPPPSAPKNAKPKPAPGPRAPKPQPAAAKPEPSPAAKEEAAAGAQEPVFALFGDARFYLMTSWDSLSGTEGVDIAEIKVISGKPFLQAVGTKNDELKVAIVYDMTWCKPLEELTGLREMMASKAAHPLVFGDGLFRGNFVLTDISVRVARTDMLGAAERLEIDVSLKEYAAPPRAQLGKGRGRGKPSGAKKPYQPPRVTSTTVTNVDGFSQNITRRS